MSGPRTFTDFDEWVSSQRGLVPYNLKWNSYKRYIAETTGEMLGSLYRSCKYRTPLPVQESDQAKNGVMLS